jgi:hypothetical protein
MSKVVLILSLLTSFSAAASMECTGRTADGKFVTVKVITTGVVGKPSEGSVSVFDGDNTFGYAFAPTDISQYYERALFSSEQTFVGLLAYTAGENPIDLYYNGVNFADQDIKSILQAPGRQKIQGSQMLVWKGPGNTSTEQYQMDDFACGVWAGI